MARFNLGRFNLAPFNRAGGKNNEVFEGAGTISAATSFVATSTQHVYDGILRCTLAAGARATQLGASSRDTGLSATLRDTSLEAI